MAPPKYPHWTSLTNLAHSSGSIADLVDATVTKVVDQESSDKPTAIISDVYLRVLELMTEETESTHEEALSALRRGNLSAQALRLLLEIAIKRAELIQKAITEADTLLRSLQERLKPDEKTGHTEMDQIAEAGKNLKQEDKLLALKLTDTIVEIQRAVYNLNFMSSAKFDPYACDEDLKSIITMLINRIPL